MSDKIAGCSDQRHDFPRQSAHRGSQRRQTAHWHAACKFVPNGASPSTGGPGGMVGIGPSGIIGPNSGEPLGGASIVGIAPSGPPAWEGRKTGNWPAAPG